MGIIIRTSITRRRALGLVAAAVAAPAIANRFGLGSAQAQGAAWAPTRNITLVVPYPALAHAIVNEWAAQGDKINPRTMPLTGLANAAIDHMAADPARHVAALSAYGANDLLCYRAPEEQADLAREQVRVWNPILDWAEQRFDVQFTITQGVSPVDQPAATVQTLHSATAALSPWHLAAMTPLVTISGSWVAGFAVLHRAFDSDTLWLATCLDALWQEAQWGAVDDAEELRAHHKLDWDAAARFLSLIDV